MSSNQAREIEILTNENRALRARMAELEELIAAFQAAAMLNTSGGDPDGITPADVEWQVQDMREARGVSLTKENTDA